MKKSFLFLCLCLLVLAGCKKESTQIDAKSVSIVMLPAEDNSVSTTQYNYKLKAMIVSPGKLETEDYGFLVSGVSPTELPLSVGSGSIAGGIEFDFPSPLPEGQFTVAAYAKLKNGETIYSVGYMTTPPAANPVVITSAYYNNAFEGVGKATFEGIITNNNPSRYQITEIGINYATDGDYPTLGYTEQRYIPYGSAGVSNPFSMQYNIDGNDFYGKANYHYQIYANVLDLTTTNSFPIYTGDLTFSTP